VRKAAVDQAAREAGTRSSGQVLTQDGSAAFAGNQAKGQKAANAVTWGAVAANSAVTEGKQ